MAAECGAQGCKGVIEVGPGHWRAHLGALSSARKKVCAIELDSRLFPVLEETLAGRDNVKIIPGDVMKLDLNQLIRQEFGGGPVCVCANLPYYITSPVILRLLEEGLPLTSITVMVQKEAAQRLCAAPGGECGAVSVAVHYRSQPKLLFQVGRGSFLPPPKGGLRRPPAGPAPGAPGLPWRTRTGFSRVSRAAFAQRRKTAANSLSATLGLPSPRWNRPWRPPGRRRTSGPSA